MTSSSDNRTRASASLVGKTASLPTYDKDLESAFEACRHSMRLSYDSLGNAIGLNGETVRQMFEPTDRHHLGASRIARILRAFGTAEPFNAYMRLPGHEIGGIPHQLVPCPRASSGDLLADTAAAARECTTALEVLIELMEGGVDPLEAVTLLRLYRPMSERLLGAVAQLEAIARRVP